MECNQRYISNIVTHFVGRGVEDKEKNYETFKTILKEGFISHYPHKRGYSGNLHVNTDASYDLRNMFNAEVTCFADIPMNDLKIHMNKYSEFGIGFKKEFLIENGANPVFYVNEKSMIPINYNFDNDGKLVITKIDRKTYFETNIKSLFTHLQKLDDFYNNAPEVIGRSRESIDLQKVTHFLDFYIFSFIKSWELKDDENDDENYYYEREWRIVGNIEFNLCDVERIIIPKDYSKRFREDFSSYFGEIIFSNI